MYIPVPSTLLFHISRNLSSIYYAILFAGAISFANTYYSGAPDIYTTFSAGYATFDGTPKHNDIYLCIALILVTIIGVGSVETLFHHFNEPHTRVNAFLLRPLSIPLLLTILYLGQLFQHTNPSAILILPLLFSSLLSIFFIILQIDARQRALTYHRIHFFLPFLFLIPSFIGFQMTIIRLAQLTDMPRLSTYSTSLPLYIAFCSLTVTMWSLLRVVLRRQNLTLLPVRYVLQLHMPLLFTTYYPIQTTDTNGFTIEANPSMPTVLSIIFFISLFTILIFRHMITNAQQSTISPITYYSLIPILIILRTGLQEYPVIGNDDYHWSEQQLGAWLYLKDATPYVTYFPPHGVFEDDLSQYINLNFLHGTASTLRESMRVTQAICLILSTLCFYAFTRSRLLSILYSLFLGPRLAWLLLTPLVILTARYASPSYRLSTIIGWPLYALIAILACPPQGIPFALATLPIFSLMLYYKYRRNAMHQSITILSLALLSTILFTYCFSSLKAIFEYGLSNTQYNSLIYGIPWSTSWKNLTPVTLILEFTRFSWILLIALLFHMLFRPKRAAISWTSRSLLLAFFLFLTYNMPYMMGRIDPQSPSRPGIISLLAWNLLAPVLLYPLVNPTVKQSLIYAQLLFSCTLQPLNIRSQLLTDALRVAVPSPPITRAGDMVSATLGLAVMNPEHRDNLVTLQFLFDQVQSILQRRPTFLDLNNRASLYYYLNIPPPIPIPNYYNLASVPLQHQALALLLSEPVDLILLQSSRITYDNASPSLRVPILYRHILKSYTPISISGTILGIRNDLYEAIAQPLSTKINLTATTSGNQNAILTEALSNTHLHHLPGTWGKSVSSLQRLLTEIYPEALSEPEPVQVPFLGSQANDTDVGRPLTKLTLHIAGTEVDFIEFNFHCSNIENLTPEVIIQWSTNPLITDTTQGQLRFSGRNGRQLVPVSSYPTWRLSQSIEGLVIYLANPDACYEANVSLITFWKQKID